MLGIESILAGGDLKLLIVGTGKKPKNKK